VASLVAARHRGQHVAAEPPQDQLGDPLDLAQLFQRLRLAFCDLQQRAVAEHLEGRAVDLPRARVAHQEQLAQHGEGGLLHAPRALDLEIAELVELPIRPLAARQRLELLVGPGAAPGLRELARERLCQPDQVLDVGRGVGELRRREGAHGPVGALLVLRK